MHFKSLMEIPTHNQNIAVCLQKMVNNLMRLSFDIWLRGVS